MKIIEKKQTDKTKTIYNLKVKINLMIDINTI